MISSMASNKRNNENKRRNEEDDEEKYPQNIRTDTVIKRLRREETSNNVLQVLEPHLPLPTLIEHPQNGSSASTSHGSVVPTAINRFSSNLNNYALGTTVQQGCRSVPTAAMPNSSATMFPISTVPIYPTAANVVGPTRFIYPQTSRDATISNRKFVFNAEMQAFVPSEPVFISSEQFPGPRDSPDSEWDSDDDIDIEFPGPSDSPGSVAAANDDFSGEDGDCVYLGCVYMGKYYENPDRDIERDEVVSEELVPVQNESLTVNIQKKNDKVEYISLTALDKVSLVPNVEPFECPVCISDVTPGEGVILHDCLHTFCKDCLRGAVEHSDRALVMCPFQNDQYSCESSLQDREIKCLVTEEIYEKHLKRSVAMAERQAADSFHCKTADCPGWCLFEDNVNIFRCPVCGRVNCLTCAAIHEGRDCKKFQDELAFSDDTDENTHETKKYLQQLLGSGEAMKCPVCYIVISKKTGCDWIQCTMCRTEICWVTKGPRWGPKGKGDTTGGCKCMLNGLKCHPTCNYCH